MCNVWCAGRKVPSGGGGGGSVSAEPAERRANALAALRALCDSAALQPHLIHLLTAKCVLLTHYTVPIPPHHTVNITKYLQL